MSLRDLTSRGLGARLARHSGIYAGGMVLQQATAALLLPIYIGFLTPEQFGIVALAEVLSALLVSVISLGTQNAVTRHFLDWEQQGVERAAVASVWGASLAIGLAMTVLFHAFGGPALGAMFRAPGIEGYLGLILWQAFFVAATQLPRALLRIREQARAFVIFSYATSGATLLFNLVLVAGLGQGELGVLRGNLLGAAVSLAACVWIMVPRMAARWDGRIVREAFAFSLPMLPGAFFDAAVRGVDRWVLDRFVSLRAVGLYSVAMKVANVALRTVMTTAFKTAWLPFAIRLNTEREDGRIQTAAFANLIVVAGAIMGAATVLYAGDVLAVLGDGYHPAAAYVTLLTAANLVLMFDLFAWVGVMMGLRTGFGSIAVAAQLIAAVALNFALVPVWGATGAALATLGSSVALIAVKMTGAQRAYPVPYQWGRIALVLAATLAFMTVAGSIESGAPDVTALGLALKTLSLLLFTALVVYIGAPSWLARLAGRRTEGSAAERGGTAAAERR